jgi:hypothetical protein
MQQNSIKDVAEVWILSALTYLWGNLAVGLGIILAVLNISYTSWKFYQDVKKKNDDKKFHP